MICCISDIHGENDRFEQMLKLIDFSNADTLYILGDVIDRGVGGVDVLLQNYGISQYTYAAGEPRIDMHPDAGTGQYIRRKRTVDD